MDITSVVNGPRIVVGVENSATSSAAVAWAVDECAVRGGSLLIAHCPAPADPRQIWADGEVALRVMDQRADALLTTFASGASRRRQSVVVSTHLSHSDPANALVDLSTGSQMVVVGAPGGRSAAFGVGRRVVAHGNCPVIVIPDPVLMPLATRPTRAVVHVVTGGEHDEAARCFAEDEAARRGVPLETLTHETAVQALRAEPVALAVVGRRESDDHWSARLDGPLDNFLAALPCPLAIVGVTAMRPPALTTRRPESMAIAH